MLKEILSAISAWILPLIIGIILIFGIIKKVPCYETFIEGGKEGLNVVIKILPYLVAIIVSVSMFRASGAIEFLSDILSKPLNFLKIPIETLPIMITRSLSGSATLGILSDTITSTGVDSYASKLSSVIVGSSETTFYVLAVYFGAIGIKKIKYALIVGLLADIFGIIMAVTVSRYFFL